MKKALTFLLISVLFFITACGSESAASENLFKNVSLGNSSVQSASFFTSYHSVLNPDNDLFLNSSPLDKQFITDFSAELDSSAESDVLQKYINLWSAEMNTAESTLKSFLDVDVITSFEESQTAWETELDKDLSSFSESYLSANGSGSDISIYTGYLMLEKVRTRALELIDQILFFGGDYTFSQTAN